MELTPELIRKHAHRLVEATTTVDQYTKHSKTGKVFTVKQHERKIGDKEGFSLMTNAMTTTVKPENIDKIMFKVKPKGISLADMNGEMGNVSSFISAKELAGKGMTVNAFASWLSSKGAKSVKGTRQKKAPPPVYD